MILLRLLLIVSVFCLSIPLRAESGLTFSGTMEWNPEYLAFTKKTPKLLPAGWQASLMLVPPPANDSDETRQELATLLTLIPQRVAAKERILAERDVNEFLLGSIRFGDLMDVKRYPRTKELMDTIYHDLGIVVFTLKQSFNRVRPSFLESKLELLISNPKHPAYPSGHSTCAHTFALVLGELSAEHKEQMWQHAGEIAFRREIAGVHYASDSAAGQELARLIFAELQKSPAYLKLINNAKLEWK